MVKIGIEVHRRLATHKLFCGCSSEISEDAKPELDVKRQLRPTASELGELDKASKHEFEKRKQFDYLVIEKNSCLVELDEEPPHCLNDEALSIALEIAMNLNAKIVDEIHMMRKIVIDGSNTSGFQRTGIISLGGFLETSKGNVGIILIGLEEESAGIVSTENASATYKLDRLGIPLVEIATAPDIKDSAHLLEVAEKIGMILRATGKVARGLGTIRQDLNISIEKGARVEIKGVQELKLLPLLAELEVKRQENLLKIISELKTRFNGKIAVQSNPIDLTEVFRNTGSKLIRNGISSGQRVFGLKLQHHAGLIGREIQPNRRYGTELSDYAKTAGVKGIIHSDEQLEKYDIKNEETQKVRTILKTSADDGFALVVAEQNIATKALEKVCQRANMDYIPVETRKPSQDGTSSFMRPMPGRARMYPETDIPIIPITRSMLKQISENRGESLEDKKGKLLKLLNKEMAERMIKSRNLALFERLAAELPNVEPMLIANTLENTLVSLRREGIELQNAEEALHDIFEGYSKGRFVKAAIPELIKLMAKGSSLTDSIKNGNLSKITGAELEKIAKENNYDMKKIMAQHRLRVEAEDIAKCKTKG